MTTLLTNQEKIAMINQAIKQVDYSIYGIELDLIQAEAVSQVDAEDVSTLNIRISDFNSKRAALVTELATLAE